MGDTKANPPSFFLMAWTALDDMLSHAGPVIRKKSLEEKATSDAVVTSVAADMAADDDKQSRIGTEVKPEA